MKRRELIALLGGVAAMPLLLWPIAARAQPTGKPRTIGDLGGGGRIGQRAWVDAFVRRLREPGWIEGRTATLTADRLSHQVNWA